MIYATDEHGKLDPEFSPIIDGSLGFCCQLFRLMLSYLKEFNLKAGSQVRFIGFARNDVRKEMPRRNRHELAVGE